MLWFLLIVGCPTSPQRDEGGCWTSAKEAWLALRSAECGGLDEQCGARGSDCEGSYDDWLAVDDPPLCFDGCNVDRCLDAMANASEDCDSIDYVKVCFSGDVTAFTDRGRDPSCTPVTWD
ncbi:MAG: hypothetical protein FJ102_05990 [Deltaproteobacteria bacterium]|nr:hypothetical protein [Deltaproteobacteria bacterium]